MSDELERVYSLDEAAEKLQITVEQLKRLVRVPKIAYLKTGRTLTFPESALQGYITANTTPALAPNPFGLTDRSLKRVRTTA